MTTQAMVELSVSKGDLIAPAPAVRPRTPGGVAVAALLSGMFGMLTLAIVNVFTAASKDFNAFVHDIGKLWMPGAAGIGPYAGKETLALVAWLGTWVVLHLALRRHDVPISRWLIVFLLGVGLATTLVWPPVFEHLAGH